MEEAESEDNQVASTKVKKSNAILLSNEGVVFYISTYLEHSTLWLRDAGSKGMKIKANS